MCSTVGHVMFGMSLIDARKLERYKDKDKNSGMTMNIQDDLLDQKKVKFLKSLHMPA